MFIVWFCNRLVICKYDFILYQLSLSLSLSLFAEIHVCCWSPPAHGFDT